jgi:hypothetical protein
MCKLWDDVRVLFQPAWFSVLPSVRSPEQMTRAGWNTLRPSLANCLHLPCRLNNWFRTDLLPRNQGKVGKVWFATAPCSRLAAYFQRWSGLFSGCKKRKLIRHICTLQYITRSCDYSSCLLPCWIYLSYCCVAGASVNRSIESRCSQ